MQEFPTVALDGLTAVQGGLEQTESKIRSYLRIVAQEPDSEAQLKTMSALYEAIQSSRWAAQACERAVRHMDEHNNENRQFSIKV